MTTCWDFFLTMHRGSNQQEVSPPPLLSEQQTFKGLSIDVAVIAAVPYRHSRTTFHLISMTFHRQPSVPGPRAGEGEGDSEKQRERCAGLHTTDSSRDLQNQSTFVVSLWELQPKSISTRLNLTLSAIHLFPRGHNVSHLPSHLQLELLPKLPIQAQAHSRGCRTQINAPNSAVRVNRRCQSMLLEGTRFLSVHKHGRYSNPYSVSLLGPPHWEKVSLAPEWAYLLLFCLSSPLFFRSGHSVYLLSVIKVTDHPKNKNTHFLFTSSVIYPSRLLCCELLN